jgi:CubicO group peptidase (beta-lactamase class C family)
MERAAGKDLAQLLSDDLWAKLGAEQDAYVLLDHHQQACSSAGFNATLRDLGRFGQMMAHRHRGRAIAAESDDKTFGTQYQGIDGWSLLARCPYALTPARRAHTVHKLGLRTKSNDGIARVDACPCATTFTHAAIDD